MLENSDAKVVVVEDDEQLEKIRAVRDRLPLLEHVVRMTGASEDAISLDDLAARGAGRDAAEWERAGRRSPRRTSAPSSTPRAPPARRRAA